MKKSQKVKQLNLASQIELGVAFLVITYLYFFAHLPQVAYYRGGMLYTLPAEFMYILSLICYAFIFFVIAPIVKKQFKENNLLTLGAFTFIVICFYTQLISNYFALLLSIKMVSLYFVDDEQDSMISFSREAVVLTGLLLFFHSAYIIYQQGLINSGFVYLTPILTLTSYLLVMHFWLPKINSKNLKALRFIGILMLDLFVTILILVVAENYYSYSRDSNKMVPITLFIQVIIHIIAKIIYKSRIKRQNSINNLESKLETSDASLTFLKSQINPHFLFNALNTIYGMSIQENAIRTGEGIQKLGDMMRFMLHENLKDTIELKLEIEYLSNYISLQKLRIVMSEQISIESHIQPYVGNLSISPMLLIPFVENAFKHGISLKKPSYINISFSLKDNVLYFDVSNTVHDKAENDPEEYKSGIGLENVKQRLSLLYPNRHELIIRESANEFFVHLTLQLD